MASLDLQSEKGVNGFSSSRDSEIAALISSLKSSLPGDGSPNSYDREKLKDVAHKLSLVLETPGETVLRVAYLPLQTSVIRIANRLKLFTILTESNGPISGQSLAQTVNADPLLLLRLLRFLVAMGAIAEAGVEMYVATNTTRNLSVPNLEAGVNHTFDTIDQAAMALPAFLGKNNYQTPTDPLHCPFNDAFRTTDSLFEWFPKHPEELRDFNVWMTGQREGRANWLDFFPFKKQLADGFQDGDDAVMLVDVGGAVGHEVQAIKNRYPDLPGKFVLQDLPDTLKQAVAVPGMQTMVHDFFTPQPLKGNKPAMIRAILPVPRPSSWADHLTSLHHSGARAYYLRNILHDWPDDKCRIILSQLRDAMKEGYSKIVLNELVLPVQGANLLGAYRDIAMMVCLGAMERNERQWRDLFHSVGLRVEKIWTDTPDAESIIEVVLK